MVSAEVRVAEEDAENLERGGRMDMEDISRGRARS